MKSQGISLKEHFSSIKDPRIERKKRHLLIDIIIIALCGVICGAEGWEQLESFGKSRHAWLKNFLELPNGIPHHDTFRRVFSRLCPQAFEACFRGWIASICELFDREVIAIDGKSLRHSYKDSNHKHSQMLHMVSAWATQNNLILGQVKTADKSNEITAIPELLQLLALKGAIVTIDAMGCQRAIAEQIVVQKADYVLAVKENQGKLYEALQNTFEKAKTLGFQGMVYDYATETDSDHGRVETRSCTVLPLMYLHQFKIKWKGLQSLVMIESERVIKATGEVSLEKRFYISSLPAEAKPIQAAVRAHWGIENKVHWVLDVVFREDDSRIREGYGAQNFSVLRRFAMNMLRQESSEKKSMKMKRYIATMDVVYLQKVLMAAKF